MYNYNISLPFVNQRLDGSIAQLGSQVQLKLQQNFKYGPAFLHGQDGGAEGVAGEGEDLEAATSGLLPDSSPGAALCSCTPQLQPGSASSALVANNVTL